MAISITSRPAGRRTESASLSFPTAAATRLCGHKTIPGGAQTQLVPKEKHYLKPVGQLSITVLDPAGQPTPARIFVVGEDGRAYAPDDAWMNADDNFVRSERPFEAHYFHTPGNAEMTLPAGTAEVEVMKGFEYRFERRTVNIAAGQQLRSDDSSAAA